MKFIHMFLCLTLAMNVVAQDFQLKIGVVSGDKILTSDRARKIFHELDVQKKRVEKDITIMENKMQYIDNQLQSPSIGESGKESLRKQRRDLEFELKKTYEDNQARLQKMHDTASIQLNNEIAPLIKELANEQNIQLVLTLLPDIIAYVDEKCIFKFSEEIVSRYDAKYKADTSIDNKNVILNSLSK